MSSGGGEWSGPTTRDRPVARAVVDELLELAVRAPSAGFTQGWRFLVLDDHDVTSIDSGPRRPRRRRAADTWLCRHADRARR